jgi:hypothetical protein
MLAFFPVNEVCNSNPKKLVKLLVEPAWHISLRKWQEKRTHGELISMIWLLRLMTFSRSSTAPVYIHHSQTPCRHRRLIAIAICVKGRKKGPTSS